MCTRGFRPFRSPKNLESSADAVLFWFANPTREKPSRLCAAGKERSSANPTGPRVLEKERNGLCVL